MEKIRFYNELKEVLDLDENVNQSTSFHLTSLTILSVIVFIDENFNKQVNASELKRINSVLSLMELIGMGNFK